MKTFRFLIWASLLAVGFNVVWGAVVGLLLSVAERMRVRQAASAYILVGEDGEAVVARYDGGLRVLYRYETLEGKPIELQVGMQAGAYLDASPPRGVMPWSQRLSTYMDGQRPPGLWYFVNDGHFEGTGYFVGFDFDTRHCLGYLGRNGFRPDPPPDEDRFPIRGGSDALGAMRSSLQFASGRRIQLASDDKLLEVDLQQRQVKSIGDFPGIVAHGWLNPAVKLDHKRKTRTIAIAPARYIVRAREELVLVDPETLRQTAVPLPRELPPGTLTVFSAAEPDTLLLVFTARRPRRGTSDYTLLWLAQDGRVTREERRTVTQGIPEWSANTSFFAAALVSPAPISEAFMAFVAFPFHLVETGDAPTYDAGLRESLAAVWPAWLATCVVGVVGAWGTWRHHRGHAQPQAWVWCLFSFVLGLPGYLAYRFHRTWPAREMCSHCGRETPRDREACAFCGQNFAPPSRLGTEVFSHDRAA